MYLCLFKIKEIITHSEAYKRLPNKRMGNKNPNGNIIVDENGHYNPFDLGAHEDKFNEIKKYYIIGEIGNSKLFKEKEIKLLAEKFNLTLNKIFNTTSKSNFEIITRKGRRLNEIQVK